MRRKPVSITADDYTETADGCWVWGKGVCGAGYGKMTRTIGSVEKALGAHRVSYQQHKGPVPEGVELDHLCRNKRCVNPAHLEAVTHAENVRRAVSRDVCRNGHPYDAANTYVWAGRKGGQKTCRACNRENQARRAERLKKSLGDVK